MQKETYAQSVPEIKTGRVEFGCQRYQVGRNTMFKLAKEAGAVIKVGRIWLFNVSKMDEYFDDLTRAE